MFVHINRLPTLYLQAVTAKNLGRALLEEGSRLFFFSKRLSVPMSHLTKFNSGVLGGCVG